MSVHPRPARFNAKERKIDLNALALKSVFPSSRGGKLTLVVEIIVKNVVCRHRLLLSNV